MTYDTDRKSTLPLSARKQALIAEGQIYRLGITHSKALVVSNLSAESMARSMIGHIATGMLGAFKGNGLLKSPGLQTLLPFLISAFSALPKRSLIKPVLRGVALIGAFGAAVAVFAARKRKKNEEHNHHDDFRRAEHPRH